MKRYLFFALLLLSVYAKGQNFEGSITWTVQYQLPDTALKEGMISFFPKEFTLFSGNKSWLLLIDQGMLHTEMGWQNEKHQLYSIDRNAKIYTWITEDSSRSNLPDSLKPVVVRTNEKQFIQGYSCNKYIVHLTRRDTSMLQIFWTTTAIKVAGIENLRNQRGKEVFYEGMEGLPLRMELVSRELSLVIAATQIKKGLADPNILLIPADFKEQKKNSK